jgi:hypothetical protein
MYTTFTCSLPLDTYSGCVLFETRLGPRLYWLGILVDSFSSPMEIPGSHVVDVKTTFFHIPPNLLFTNRPIINAVTCQNTRRHIPNDSHIHGIQTQFSIKIGLFLCWIEQIWASVTKLLHYVCRQITNYVLARYNYCTKMSTCDASRINISETWRERASNTMDLLRSYEDMKLKTDLSGTHAYLDPLWEANHSQNFSDIVGICHSVSNIVNCILPTNVRSQNIRMSGRKCWELGRLYLALPKI